jgi:hypothetical protein
MAIAPAVMVQASARWVGVTPKWNGPYIPAVEKRATPSTTARRSIA